MKYANPCAVIESSGALAGEGNGNIQSVHTGFPEAGKAETADGERGQSQKDG